jgi:Uncharacterized protein conserved in bacteria
MELPARMKIRLKPDYNGRLAVKDTLLTPQTGVKLNDGLFERVFDNNIAFLKTLDVGAMKYWFDVKTDTPTDAEPYRGHFEDNLKGSTLSMFLMGAANALRWGGDSQLYSRADELLDRLYSAAESDGFLMPVDKKRFAYREYPHYVRIWLTYALLAAGLSCDPHAYDVLRKWQDWFNACRDLPVIKYLELAFQGVVASPQVYLSPVGRKRDITITEKYYTEEWRLAQFMRRERDAVHIRHQPGAEPHPHGSELEAFEGYLDLYRATGRNYYLDAVLGVWELYRRDWQHAGGGIVMCEGEGANYPGCRWIDRKHPYNELCCTSFWIYINQRLHRLFPDEEVYVSEIEKSLFNIAIANQDGGEGIRYFAYMEGKKMPSGKVHCCCGVGTRIFGSLPEFIFSVGKKTVSVDLYAPSELTYHGITLINEGNIPYSDKVKLTVKTDEPAELTLRLRIPSWCAVPAEIMVNGEAIAVGQPRSYFVLEREWHDGDTVEYTLAQEFKILPYSGDGKLEGKTRRSIERGPILYCVTGEEPVQGAKLSLDNFTQRLTPATGQLYYELGGGYRLEPYFLVGGDAEFSCYPVIE